MANQSCKYLNVLFFLGFLQQICMDRSDDRPDAVRDYVMYALPACYLLARTTR
jgi:hypothetical protein